MKIDFDIELYDKQYEAFFNDARFKGIEASTKSGKTVGALVWLVYLAIQLESPKKVAWLAPSAHQAKIAFRRAQNMLPDEVYRRNKVDRYLQLQTPDGTEKARIDFIIDADPDLIYGDEYHRAVVDEASRVDEEAWSALLSTLTQTQGDVAAIGNVKNRTNWHYKLCRRAEKDENDNMHYTKITYEDAIEGGVLDEEMIEQMKKRYEHDPEKFKALYECVPPSGSGNPFGHDSIDDILIDYLSDNEPRMWGWDVAVSEDYTVGIPLDKHGRVCEGWVRTRQGDWQTTFDTIMQASEGKPIVIDSSGAGGPIADWANHTYTGQSKPVTFTAQVKQRLMRNLKKAIHHRNVRVPRDTPIEDELRQFRYETKPNGTYYSAPAGRHDDCVVALALVASYGGYAKTERNYDNPVQRSAEILKGGSYVQPFY